MFGVTHTYTGGENDDSPNKEISPKMCSLIVDRKLLPAGIVDTHAPMLTIRYRKTRRTGKWPNLQCFMPTLGFNTIFGRGSHHFSPPVSFKFGAHCGKFPLESKGLVLTEFTRTGTGSFMFEGDIRSQNSRVNVRRTLLLLAIRKRPDTPIVTGGELYTYNPIGDSVESSWNPSWISLFVTRSATEISLTVNS
ncbi:hypothetical protein K435DRAFT_800883 [Dendrothele bispora CBS 962.96]|uniref:Uncharacterized protein n=1 Tax=Dendrothele bispora (strain CBS 962.96) TaxID=1314807 RepID=A0A4S8LSR6_DENBC|nr:hypothetical protein K435DRAFT_800883 [Dendrothele bispora CBS 962.96]